MREEIALRLSVATPEEKRESSVSAYSVFRMNGFCLKNTQGKFPKEDLFLQESVES